jgi:hypothetical protein
MTRLEIELKFITPAFLRGIHAGNAVLRPPGFKGQLRWWYRAWNPLAYEVGREWSEGRIFGGTRQGEGQCPFLLRLEATGKKLKLETWEEIERRASSGDRRRPGGVHYLGFPFRLRKKEGPLPRAIAKKESPLPRAIAAGVEFKAIHLFRAEPSPEQIRGILAAWWLLTHLGGVGARSRRGFGGVSLQGWRWVEVPLPAAAPEVPAGASELLEQLPLPATAQSVEEWRARMISGLRLLERWVPVRSGWPPGVPRLDPESVVVLNHEQRGWSDWLPALEAAGKTLSAGRWELSEPRAEVDGRVTFGLPLKTGAARSRVWRPGSFRLEPLSLADRRSSPRHASPLHLRLGAWRGGLTQCWTLVGGPRPGIGDYRVATLGEGVLRAQARDAVALFTEALSESPWRPTPMPDPILLNLDVSQQISWKSVEPELRRPYPSVREIRYRDVGGAPVSYPVDNLAVDWRGLGDAVEELAGKARDADEQAQEKLGAGVEILVMGRGPLPAFAWLGLHLQPWAGTRQVLFNFNKEGSWDRIDLLLREEGAEDPFDRVEGMEGSDRDGVIALFISPKGVGAQAQGLRDYLQREERKCAGVVSIGTGADLRIDSRSGARAARQLGRILSQLPGLFPNNRGIALFVDGPATLAFIAGRALNPNLFHEIHCPNYAGGRYGRALVRQSAASPWRWAFFLAHAGPDAEVAEQLFEPLDRPGRAAFLDSKRLLPGDDWRRKLLQGLRDSRVAVILISPRTDSAYYQQEEIREAIERSRSGDQRVVPLCLPGAGRDDLADAGLGSKHAIFMGSSDELPEVAKRLHDLLDRLDGEDPGEAR